MAADDTGEGQPGARKAPNLILRRIREQERHETRAEFAEAMARAAREMGESAFPDEKYVGRLESGDIKWPRPLYQRILTQVCGRPVTELGFAKSGLSPRPSDHGPGNLVLRDAILASGMEISDFARRVGVDPKTAERWVTRGRIPHPRHRWNACEALGRSESELWPSLESGRASADNCYSEDVIDVLSRIQELNRGSVHPDVIQQLQDRLRHTVTQYEKLDHANLALALVKQRSWIDAILDECRNPRQHIQLSEIAGATSGVLGYVAVGRGDFALARAYCLEAFQLGEFAGNSGLQAWARGIQSFCEYYACRYDEALRFAEDGLSYAQSGPQSVRLTINGAARALGKLGDAEGVHRAVDQAYELMSRNDVPGGVPSSISFECYSAAQTASNAATSYVALGQPEKVQHYVGLALPEINKSESPWSRSLVMIDLAVSLIRAREADADHAAGLVIDALNISADRPIISVQQRTSEFIREATDRWGNLRQIGAVRDAASAMKVR
jgi:transcriptional regulator with XRE-family HTH domain